jgi:O-succinylbenzoic acid--CoA ligase
MANSDLYHYFTQHRNCPFLITPNQSLSFGQVWDLACTKDSLQHIQPGIIVPYPAELSIETIINFFSLLIKGAIPLPYHPRNPLGSSLFPEKRGEPYDSGEIHLFTSGSSGTPKQAILSVDRFLANAKGAGVRIPFQQGDRWRLELPLNHVGGISILFRALLYGGAVQIGLPISLATHASMVPTQLHRYIRDNIPLSNLKAILVGGGPSSDSLLDQAVNRGIPFHLTYGMTEMASQICTAGVMETGHSGQPLSGREVKIGLDREIWIRGEPLFHGYLGGQQIYQADWFPTRDLGRFNQQGKLVIIGRKDRMIICGGENIHPEEIESALNQFPGIIKARVEGISDAEFGCRPIAYLYSENKEWSIETEKIVRFLRDRLPPIKIPIQFHEMDEVMVQRSQKTPE